MESSLQLYLPLFFVAFIILVFIVPSVRVYQQTGINPFRFAKNHDQVHDYIGASMKVFILVLLSNVLVHSLSPTLYGYCLPFAYLEKDALKITGLIVGHISIAGIMVAQVQMKQSWRIGIDYEHKTGLVTTGLFSVSRNPIFLFLLLSLAGLFLVIPNAVTFAVLFSVYLILQITMRLEEDFLLKQHGAAYSSYRQKTRRLI